MGGSGHRVTACISKNSKSNFDDGASSFQGVEQAGNGSSGCGVTSLS
jgi:hypothetical protein